MSNLQRGGSPSVVHEVPGDSSSSFWSVGVNPGATTAKDQSLLHRTVPSKSSGARSVRAGLYNRRPPESNTGRAAECFRAMPGRVERSPLRVHAQLPSSDTQRQR